MRFIIGSIFLVLINACSEGSVSENENSCASLKTKVTELESQVGKTDDFDLQLASKLMRAYANFSNACQGDSLVPEYLMRRADLLRGTGQIHESIRLFESIHDGYPTYENKELCAFLAAYLFETELSDFEMAEKLYTKIIELYPDSREAELSKMSLKYLGESPEELILKFKENQ
ncbi:MAG: hypothetical protein COA49_01935 [Bacteroidetes bacterium]|nr:MAG: hypothetical protein COA49_01935 [Bacteroidota bacterium]